MRALLWPAVAGLLAMMFAGPVAAEWYETRITATPDPSTRPDVTFDAIVSGSDVENTKPAPDPYRLAVELMGVLPAQCVAIEDSAAGVESARAAGLLVIGLGDAEMLQHAHVTCSNFAEIRQLLAF